ncbi:MAG: hypothetical protein PVF17_00505 [Ignavibacteria bacterium]|jgi:hypothetical protein
MSEEYEPFDFLIMTQALVGICGLKKTKEIVMYYYELKEQIEELDEQK